MRWIKTTNHKDLGTLYMWFSFTMFMIGGMMALVIRAELFQPGLQFVDPGFFNSMTTMLAAQADLVVVEGAGGWQVPLGAGVGRFADWVADAGWPVLLVVGMRLGCLNHALLSAESIRRQSRLAGWVANCLPPRQNFWEQNVACLRDELASPCFGVVPPDADPAAHIDLGRLLDALAD